MTLKRLGPLGKIGVLLMVVGLGTLFGGLFGACGDSSVAGSENAAPAGIPLLDKEQPAELQTASFALG